MTDMIKMSDIRAKFPEYAAMPDDQLLINMHQTFYPKVPAAEFFGRIDRDTARRKLEDQVTEGNGDWSNFAAGIGKSAADLGRTGQRIANMVGIGDYDQQAAQEDEGRDAALMRTKAGFGGKLLGDVALTAVPGMGIASKATNAAKAGGRALQASTNVLPKALGLATETAAPYLGASAAGAATGAALSPSDMGQGAGIGAALGPAGELLGRGASALYAGGKAVVEPLWQQGRERILKRTLDRFATDPAAAAAAAAAPRELVPGAMPTLAEATMDPGLAQLQRGATATSPEVASAMHEATAQRLNAYKAALDELAGNDGKRTFYEGARETAAKELYGRAYAEGLQMTPELEAQFASLMKRPSIRSAIPKARALAQEKGMSLDQPAGSVAGLDWVKQALDDAIGKARNAGMTNEANAISQTKNALVGGLSEASPAYGEAVHTYAQMSRPINQMQIGQSLRNTLFPALSDFSPDLVRSRGNAYAEALRNSGRTAQGATGLNSATLEGVLEPAQLQAAHGIAQDIGRNTAAAEAGAVKGSPTAQYLGAHNILRQFLGPLGLPESALDSTVGNVMAGVLSLPFKLTGSQTQELLADALRDPRIAARLMQAKDNPTMVARVLQPYAAQAAIQIGATK